MEHLHNGYTLDIPPGAFPLSTDSVALAAFAQIPKNANVLDLCSGCGTLGLLLLADGRQCCITGVESDPISHQAALDNIRRNALEGRLFSICGDIRTIPEHMPPGSFRCCVSNPPYFPGGPASASNPSSRREDTCSLEELMAAADWALQWGGDFYLVHRPERAAELIAKASARRLEPKQLCLLRHHTGGPVTLILLRCRKGGKPGLLWEEWALFDGAGNPTEQYRKLYHC